MTPNPPKMRPVESSNLAEVGFRKHGETGALWVRFRSGHLYRYARVPAAVFWGILEAESKGRAFQQLVRLWPFVYRYRRVA